jgi:hypothetical protein
MARRGPDRRMVPALRARTDVLRSRRGYQRQPLKEERPSSALAGGSNANRGRVANREEYTARRTSQLNPDKPRRTCRLGADASVEENGGRSGEICLDTTFHRSERSAERPVNRRAAVGHDDTGAAAVGAFGGCGVGRWTQVSLAARVGPVVPVFRRYAASPSALRRRTVLFQ